jgi:CRP-like cAMP-binding protein
MRKQPNTSRPSNLGVIQACSVLNPLSAEEKEELALGSFMAFAQRGETIFLAGSRSDIVAVVGSGFVKMTKTSHTGQGVAMELLGPGQAFGILVAVEGRAYPLSAIAITDTWYLKLPTPAFMKVYKSSDGLKDHIVRTIGPRIRRAHEMMSRLSSGRVDERIAAVLLILADSYGTRENQKIQLQVPLTRQDIAEMAGTTVETTIRTMSRWQKDGMIKTEHKEITILDEIRLSQVLND